jgi:hypothetical protein
MMERLLKRGQTIGAARAEAAVDALIAKPLPPGIAVERISSGVAFSGRGLRRRYVTDARLRALIQ